MATTIEPTGLMIIPEPLAVAGVSQQHYDKQAAFREDLQRNLPTIIAAIPKGVRAEAVTQMALTAALDNPALLDCSPLSLVRATLKMAALGLRIGESCDIVPVGGKAECWVRVRGVVELAMRAKAIRWAKEGFVCEGDEFAYEEVGTGTNFTHKSRATVKLDGSNLTHVYAIITLMDGSRVFEVWPIERVLAHKAKHAKQTGAGSVWAKHPLPMMAKTVIKAALRFAPLSPELAKAVAAGDEVEGSFEVLDDPTQALRNLDASLAALPAATEPDFDGVVEDAQDGLTLAEALAVALPGKAASWGGNGGKALADVPSSVLAKVIERIDGDADRAEKFARLRAAAVMVENHREGIVS